ncbi:hypothetical protein CRENBAI_022668 [Crenichthys baileyi]|uniref:Secreted protein n=1 Tax=Crenichthys baileyi TaxID=28760 RepID=A0AAV9R950_9TELE
MNMNPSLLTTLVYFPFVSHHDSVSPFAQITAVPSKASRTPMQPLVSKVCVRKKQPTSKVVSCVLFAGPSLAFEPPPPPICVTKLQLGGIETHRKLRCRASFALVSHGGPS